MGDRIPKFSFIKKESVKLEEVDELGTTERSKQSFGSTGKSKMARIDRN